MATVLKFKLEKDKWVIDKDPGSNLDYMWPFADWLAGMSDTIVSATVSDFGGGVSIGDIEVSQTSVVVWVSGGTVSKSKLAWVTVRIVTAGGRVEERTAYFRIKQL